MREDKQILIFYPQSLGRSLKKKNTEMKMSVSFTVLYLKCEMISDASIQHIVLSFCVCVLCFFDTRSF